MHCLLFKIKSAYAHFLNFAFSLVAGTDGKEYLNQDEDIEVERIVMYVMVVLVVVVFTGLLLFCCVRCKKRREQKRHPRPITSSTGKITGPPTLGTHESCLV